jgi:hypothetical protein
LNILSTSKWLSGPLSCSWRKNDQKCSRNGHLWVINFHDFFFHNWKSRDSEKFVFYAVAFGPIKVYTFLALQNGCQHLSFEKDIYVVGKKMTRNGLEMAKLKSCILWIETDTNKETDVSWDIFMIWKINSGMWVVGWAGLWKKKVWANYEQLLRPGFLVFMGKKLI